MTDINVGAITEALNNKVDLPTPSTPQDAVDYVVEKQDPTSANGYTWYRKYKSGWVEQGGQFVKAGGQNALNEQTLPVPMANTAYYANVIFGGGAGDYTIAVGITRTTTTLKIYPFWTTAGQYCPWEVSGYAA